MGMKYPIIEGSFIEKDASVAYIDFSYHIISGKYNISVQKHQRIHIQLMVFFPPSFWYRFQKFSD